MRTLFQRLFSAPAAMFYGMSIGALHSWLGAPHGPLALLTWMAMLFLGSTMGLWVEADARKRGARWSYDVGSWILLIWPLVMPVYLFWTRGWRAFRALGWFLLMYVAACLVPWVFYLVLVAWQN
jgi:hypothetical protein